jgi:RNA polymerase sigma-70 factor (ECF subfamily)
MSQEAGPPEPALQRLRRGDAAAFEDLVRQNAARLLATARRMLGNDDDAREVLQDAFVAAFRSLSSFAGNSQLSTWLHRILVNTALMRLRRRRCRPELSIEELLPAFKGDGHHAEPPARFDDGATECLLRAENQQLVRAAIDELPPAYREVILLRDLEGLSTEATGHILNTTTNAVKIRLHRARQALRTLLTRHFDQQEP